MEAKQMIPENKPIKIIYRASVMLPVLNTMKQQGLWNKYGLEAAVTLVQNTREAEETLLQGRCDVIFGNHTSPYGMRLRGDPVVYIAQSLNCEERYLVARPEITTLKNLKGRRYLGSEHGQHPELSERFHLREAGIDPLNSGIIVSYQAHGAHNEDKLEKLLSGEVDMTILSPPWEMLAKKKGLRILAETTLETINGITVLTTTGFASQQEGLIMNLLKALSHGIHFYQTHKKESVAMLKVTTKNKDVLEDESLIEHEYEASSRILTPTLYPTALSIHTVYQMAVQEEPRLKSFNPLEAWDLHYVRMLNESGFVKNLQANL